MKNKIFIGITIVCIAICILIFNSKIFERSLSRGNLIVNYNINDSKVSKSFICSYSTDNTMINEIWLEKKMWRTRNFKDPQIYCLQFTTNCRIQQIELLLVNVNCFGFGNINSTFFIETDDKNLLTKEKVFCRVKINGEIQNIYLKKIDNNSDK